MLAEWLEKEAQGDLTKTAAQQFEAELAALDAPSIAKIWRGAKEKEAKKGSVSQAMDEALGDEDRRYAGAVTGGALGGALTGAGRGALYAQQLGLPAPAAMAAGGLLGAAGGGVGGHVYESDWGQRHPIGRYAVPILTGGVSGLGGAAIGARVHGGKERKEKKSSVDILRLALQKRASRGASIAQRMKMESVFPRGRKGRIVE